MNLIKPIITEKSISLTTGKKYAFKVMKAASKTDIKTAVEKTFGVKVLSVKTLTQHGKEYRTGKRWTTRRRSDWKKAIVAISPDKQIDLFEVTQTEKK